jgi:hypothetical protein
MTADPDCRPARRLFLVEAADETDALLRLLSVFAIRQVRVVKLEMAPIAAGVGIRLETHPMSEAGAGQLASKLSTLPGVRGVGLGWLGG